MSNNNNNNNGGGGSSSSQHQAVVLRVNRFLEKKNKLTLADLAGIPTRYVNEDVCDREGHVITPSRHITAPLKQSHWFGKKLTGSVLKGMPWPKKPSLDCDEAEFQQASAFYKPLVKAKKLVQYKSDGRWEQTTRWSKSQRKMVRTKLTVKVHGTRYPIRKKLAIHDPKYGHLNPIEPAFWAKKLPTVYESPLEEEIPTPPPQPSPPATVSSSPASSASLTMDGMGSIFVNNVRRSARVMNQNKEELGTIMVKGVRRSARLMKKKS